MIMRVNNRRLIDYKFLHKILELFTSYKLWIIIDPWNMDCTQLFKILIQMAKEHILQHINL